MGRSGAVHDTYKSAVLTSGLVTFIAAYHYMRIFNSWVEAYAYGAGESKDGAMESTAPRLTGVPFNDAYRYMDWLLTVPLLLIEILLVMKLDDDTFSSKAKTLGVTSALMIISGYYAELMTVISRCTYPVVYLFPMLGISASAAVVGIQVGYCASDIISKCGVGLLIYQITYAKSKQETLL